ncbi:uncharacterized protein B0P05DRAFT_558686 [Gilbertella persicaria]|uniref:uncharacterized protein n=1 Tax=Gilbertella persicaria TaxID=101096 RepID=UPI00221E4EAD|nr:uncharacterized protein B0P05DRAFT_558686 [Gilbertella persicaria]KAI8059435.1 hypothetical protein B0P05DRAFT_558686 [Gilbertella persicaria]
MLVTTLYKIAVTFVFVITYACANNAEAELEQPTKLLGGVLRRPEKCKQKVGSNARVKLHYRARAWGNEEFYENTFSEQPVQFKLGRDKIMKGLEQGIDGMCVGEIRRLLIPSDLAYGATGLPNLVPANTAVIYEVEMLEVDSPFRNPWFWAGLATLFFAWRFMNKYNKMQADSQSAQFLEQKAQEKKSE